MPGKAAPLPSLFKKQTAFAESPKTPITKKGVTAC